MNKIIIVIKHNKNFGRFKPNKRNAVTNMYKNQCEKMMKVHG